MGLLGDIQAELLDKNSGLGPILLKLRFLADRLGSDFLEDWVRHELEGYPKGVEVPDYRKTGVTYSGTFSNAFQQLNDVSIPSYSVKTYAGEEWVEISIRDPLSVIDDAVARSSHPGDKSQYSLNTGDLKILLQDKIYEGYSIIEIRGIFSVGAFITIQTTVRAKILDLSLKLEKQIPEARNIMIGTATGKIKEHVSDNVSAVAHQIINYGTVTNISSAGTATEINVNIAQGNLDNLVKVLSGKGIPKEEAIEFASIVSEEKPESPDQPFGKKAAAWLAQKAQKGSAEAWGIGKAVVTEVLKEAVKEFYGLK